MRMWGLELSKFTKAKVLSTTNVKSNNRDVGLYKQLISTIFMGKNHYADSFYNNPDI